MMKAMTLVVDCILLVFSLAHIPSLVARSTFPFSVVEQNGVLLIDELTDPQIAFDIASGDTVVGVNNAPVSISSQLEFLGDLSVVGSRNYLSILKEGQPTDVPVIMIPYYPNLLYIIVILFVGISFISVGLFVVLNRHPDPIAHVFHWMMVFVGTAMMITWGHIEIGSLWSIISRSLFFISYVFGVTLFLLFTRLYGVPAFRLSTGRMSMYFGFAAAVCFLLTFTHVAALTATTVRASLAAFERFQQYFSLFHIAIVATFIAGIVNIVRAYRRSEDPDEKNRLEWILWGFSISAMPFVGLYIVPQILFRRYLIPEEYTTIFFIVLPFSFGISFIKHRLFDIRILIKRTIVAFLFSGLIAATYSILVLLAAAVVNDSILAPEQLIVVALTLGIAMALNPFRILLKRYIDRLLFKTQENFGAILIRLSHQLHAAVSAEQMYGEVAETLRASLPLERCLLLKNDGAVLRPVSEDLFPSDKFYPLPVDDVRSLLPYRCSAVTSAVRHAISGTVNIDNRLPFVTGGEIFVPVTGRRTPFHGALIPFRDQTQERLNGDEIDLLISISDMLGEHLDRLDLMESIFREKEERKRAEELNRLKSNFVSMVSHELQTPLTSIRIFSELLRKPASDRRRKEFLSIITGESERLQRLVENLLDLSKIEAGMRIYQPVPCRLHEQVNRAVSTMSYMMRKHGFVLTTSFPRTPLDIHADPDALVQSIINLLSNAMKYSQKRKTLRITLRRRNDFVWCSVRDEGEGIPATMVSTLFTRFVRLPQHQKNVKGLGLGLYLVKHFMEAHHGTIDVRSTVGKGTTVSLIFPLYHPEQHR